MSLRVVKVWHEKKEGANCGLKHLTSTCNCWTLCAKAYFKILLSMRGSIVPSRWKSRASSDVVSLRREKTWDTKLVKPLRFFGKCLELNLREERCFQRLFHLGDNMHVWTACLVSRKESMWSRRQSGKLLSLSLLGLGLGLCLCLCLFIVINFTEKRKAILRRLLLRLLISRCSWHLFNASKKQPEPFKTKLYRKNLFFLFLKDRKKLFCFFPFKPKNYVYLLAIICFIFFSNTNNKV